jgi:tetratricopeptide (TPR) repeat protein
MGVLIFAPEESVRQSLQRFCRELGESEIYAFDQLSPAIGLLEKEPSNIKLILATWTLDILELNHALARIQLKEQSLHLVPFVLILPGRAVFEATSQASQLDRVDHYLIRPMNRTIFRRALQSAHERRACLRDTLLVLGETGEQAALKVLWSQKDKMGYHWKSLLVSRSQEDLKSCLEQHGARIGAILIDPISCRKELVESVVAYHRTPVGHQTPIVILSRDCERVGAMRSMGNAFVDFDERLESPAALQAFEFALELASRRLRKQWETLGLLNRSKEILKAENAKIRSWLPGRADSGLALLNDALKVDPRWEVHESLGRLFMKRGQVHLAILHFRETLKTNPYSPRAYLSLFELLAEREAEASEILRTAQRYCPCLPQIRALVEKRSRAA